jgi:hypothetical protein
MQDNDAKAATIGDYLRELLRKLWNEGESFSGKRPFGNSGWEHEIYLALGKAGHIKAEFDSEGWLEYCDDTHANKLIFRAIDSLGVN